MKAIGLLFVFILSINSQRLYECDFDYGQKCLPGLPSASHILLNETSDEPRQPASDVTAIETSNDEGECFFPFTIGTFEMFFCEKQDPDLPATCPTFNATGPRINCSEGEYGFEKFEVEETGSRSYKLDRLPDFSSGEHCIRFYYYLSDENSNGSVKVILEDSESNQNTTIVTASSRSQNRWYEMRTGFVLNNENPTIYFEFERGFSSGLYPFYIGIDDILIIDIECEPANTTTTESTSTVTTSTVSLITSTSSSTTTSIRANSTFTLSSISSTTVSSTMTSLITSSSTTTSRITNTSTTTFRITSTSTSPITSTTTRLTSTTTFTSRSSTMTTASTSIEPSTIISTILSTSTLASTTGEPSSTIKIQLDVLLVILFLFFFI